MTTVKEERARDAERALERQLLRKNPTLSDGALGYLLAEARSKLEWREYVDAGQALDITGLADAVIRSEVGQMIFGEAEEGAAAGPDVEAEIEGMTRAQRIAYARKNGLG